MEKAEREKLRPRMVVTITDTEDAKRVERVFSNWQVPIWYQCRGKGTAPSEMMDIFGLSGTTRLLTIGFASRQRVSGLFDAMTKRLSFRQRGRGVAISIPVTGLQTHLFNLLKDEVKDEVERTMDEQKVGSEYVVIWASVARDYAEDVVDAARAAGARGGTVIRGQRHSSEVAQRRFGVADREEQDFVMIIAKKENKSKIMTAISESCGMNTKAHGVVLSLPVDEVVGLEE